MAKRKIMLTATKSKVENLGLMVLSRVAKENGFEPKIHLVDNDFDELEKRVEEEKPEIVAASLYTGGHEPFLNFLSNVRERGIKTVVGGPHPTYFLKESLDYSDFVVPSLGHEGFRKILLEEVEPGIVHLDKVTSFPIPDRETFYAQSPEHKESRIKSVVTSGGCHYDCGHCYNSRKFESISEQLDDDQREEMKTALGKKGRLYPQFQRPVEEVLEEITELRKISPETEFIFFQDDIMGADIKWLEEFANKYPVNGLPFHAQLRFEFANPNNKIGRERIALLKHAGCTGLTFALESGNPHIREEILKRYTDEDKIMETLDYIGRHHGLKIRTQQMLGLPYGGTKKETPVNLDADLETLVLNVRIVEKIKSRIMPWAAIYTPYLGTFTGDLAKRQGHYDGDNSKIAPTFFEKSVLRFPRRYIGEGLSPEMKDEWLSGERLQKYLGQMQHLRNLFSFFL